MSENIHRLEGNFGGKTHFEIKYCKYYLKKNDYSNTFFNISGQGGLIIKKKKKDYDEDETSQFAVPKLPHLEGRSLLGLDKLAAEKRKEAQERELAKFKEKSRHDDNKQRTYRRPAEETPSYTGVSKEAKKRKEERREKERDRGLYESSKDKHDRTRERRHDRDDDRSERREHRRHHRDYSDRRSDRRKDWDVETPRSKRSNDDIDTPYFKAKATPSSSSWNEDEDHRTPGKLSSW